MYCYLLIYNNVKGIFYDLHAGPYRLHHTTLVQLFTYIFSDCNSTCSRSDFKILYTNRGFVAYSFISILFNNFFRISCECQR